MKKDIIEDLRAEIIKCELSRMNNTINEIQKNYLDGMIHAYNIIILNIEINYFDKP
jgi:hypothetical protein